MQKFPLLMTRPEGANARYAEALPAPLAARLTLVDCPLMRIVALPGAAEEAAGAIFTSSNGVRFAPPGRGRPAYCVGARTTQAAREAGWRAVCAGQTAEEMTGFVGRAAPVQPLCHYCGVHVRGEVVEALAALGIAARRVVLYDQPLLPPTPAASAVLEGKSPVLVPLFSPRAAAHFATFAPVAAPVWLVAMSPAVAEAAGQVPGWRTVTADEPTARAVTAAIEKLVCGNRLG